jgi:hypothetical protein
MILVTEQAVNATADALANVGYNLEYLLKKIREENPKITEYIQVQAGKSKNPLEIIGTGVVVYLLFKKQCEINDASELDDKTLKALRSASPSDLLKPGD